MSRNCLTANHMKASSSSRKPPGLGSYSIHLNLAKMEHQYESTLANTTAGMRLNALSFMLEDVGDSDLTVLVKLSDSDDLSDLMSISDDGVGDEGIDSPKCENASDETSVEDEGSISDISEIRALPEPEMDLPTFMSIAEYRPVICVTPPMDFEEFYGHISHLEICDVILDQYKIRDGEFENVRYAPARKIEYLLKLSQSYPGDPANVLQYRDWCFMCYQYTEDDMVIYDQVFGTDATIPVKLTTWPGFQPGQWYCQLRCQEMGIYHPPDDHRYGVSITVDNWAWNAKWTLELSAPYPGDAAVEEQPFRSGQFFVKPINDGAAMYAIEDTHLDYVLAIDLRHLHNEKFNLANWYTTRLRHAYEKLEHDVFRITMDDECDVGCLYLGPMPKKLAETIYAVETMRRWVAGLQCAQVMEDDGRLCFVELNGVQLPKGTSLIDSRSMGDFVSTTLVQQLKLKKTELATPLPLQMACQGSHSGINHSVTTKFEYQKISGN